eukprot:TRINITY_DN6050_c0_g1_i16.p1 TRINITY_DN6050_c0_g1~~TRINITY_DN6050_c0_g1_i16.p1  ORF type:complete len:116 (+),score=6.61 TRINITY_DN6050_c0_g1_i16:435-782(+)
MKLVPRSEVYACQLPPKKGKLAVEADRGVPSRARSTTTQAKCSLPSALKVRSYVEIYVDNRRRKFHSMGEGVSARNRRLQSEPDSQALGIPWGEVWNQACFSAEVARVDVCSPNT